MKKLIIMIVAGGFWVACSSSQQENAKDNVSERQADSSQAELSVNPPGKNFDLEGSDQKAIAIADKVMEAMGGRNNWQNTRYLYWNFFDFRTLLWDKETGNVRIEFLKEDKQILMNLRSMQGKVWIDGQLQEDPEVVQKNLQMGKSIWINDSYWLVMPFKLKDSGVTLNYVKEDTTQEGQPADLLMLTFDQVGDTPENKYEVWVDKETDLVSQWAYYKSRKDTAAKFVLPWKDYQKKGDILLSGERGERDLKDIQVLESVPDGIFEDVAVSL